jgi:ribosomal protein S27E
MIAHAFSGNARSPTRLAALGVYRPRDPAAALLYRVVQKHFLSCLRDREAEGRYLPAHIKREFAAFIKCGVLANGFMRLKCGECRHEKLVAFSCKRRGFCTSCGARLSRGLLPANQARLPWSSVLAGP